MQAIRTGKAYKRPIKTQLSDEALLGSSWVVIRGVGTVSIIVAHARGLIPLLITNQEAARKPISPQA